MNAVFLGGKRIALKPAMALGKGGEADVFDLGRGRALKVFKAPDHPDYQGLPHEQATAQARLAEHQRKLRDFPLGLPAHVVVPEELATDAAGTTVLGYAMRKVAGAEALFRLADPTFRRAGYPASDVVALFQELHRTVAALHRAGVVIGDFNDRNVLVVAAEAFLIDADSFQFGPYRCSVFTDRFVDPLLCDGGGVGGLQQVRPYAIESDWYAFAVLLMQSLLFVGPYGGIYKPRSASDRIPQAARPLRRVTVFHPEVVYPKPAACLASLPDALLDQLHRVFEQDQRGEFPVELLGRLQFSRCPKCQLEHARLACPACSPTAAQGLRTTVAVRVHGEVTCKRLFETHGLLLEASVEDGQVRWLCHEDGAFRREDGSVALRGPLDPRLRFAIRGKDTLVGRAGELVTLSPDQAPEKLAAESFASDGKRRFWIQDRRLMRETLVGALAIPESVGEVLAGQTRFWIASTPGAVEGFGFGFYRAGTLSVAFAFDAARGGLNDQLKLPPLPGQLLGATCALDDKRAWLRLALQTGGRTRHLCLVYSRSGNLEASAEADAGDGSWLGTLGGACAVGGMLLVATDAGIARVEILSGGGLAKTRDFPDTEPFVSSQSRLLIGREGLVVVNPQDLAVLQMP
ncbi:MAG TPA: hypothetical protein VGK67_02860 [Myxococcales bacterium]